MASVSKSLRLAALYHELRVIKAKEAGLSLWDYDGPGGGFEDMRIGPTTAHRLGTGRWLMGDWLDRIFCSRPMENFVRLMALIILTCGAILLVLGLSDRL